MQAYFLTRGDIYSVERFIDFLKTRAVYLPFEDKATGQKLLQPLSLGVRPIQLWEVFGPDEAKDIIFNSLKFGPEHLYPNNWKMKSMIAGMRLALQAEPIPEFKRDKTLFMPLQDMKNIQIIPIGYRKDAVYEDDKGTKHEAI